MPRTQNDGPIGDVFGLHLPLPLAQGVIDYILEKDLTPASPTPTGCISTFVQSQIAELINQGQINIRPQEEVHEILNDRRWIKRQLERRAQSGKEI